jgi:GNAT superfamily N-acetyltransferase
MTRPQFHAPSRLEKSDPVERFDCGVEPLNVYLRHHALAAQSANGARTYVARTAEGEIAGYHTLAFGSVDVADAPDRMRKGLARHPVPVMLLARLAVSERFRGHGLGGGLLLDACSRTLQAADIAGLRAMVVDAKDGTASRFYRHFHFQPFGDSQPDRLFLLISDLRKTLPSI